MGSDIPSFNTCFQRAKPIPSTTQGAGASEMKHVVELVWVGAKGHVRTQTKDDCARPGEKKLCIQRRRHVKNK